MNYPYESAVNSSINQQFINPAFKRNNSYFQEQNKLKTGSKIKTNLKITKKITLKSQNYLKNYS